MLGSLREYAKRRGVALSAVQKAIDSGRIAWDGRKLDFDEADKQWKQNTAPRPSSNRVLEIANADPNGLDRAESHESGYQKSRAVVERFKALNANLDYKERLAKLLPRDDVVKAIYIAHRTLRDHMLAIPDRVAGELAAEMDIGKVRERLTVEISERLAEFADVVQKITPDPPEEPEQVAS